MESKLFPNEFDDLSYWEFVNSSDVEDGQSANADDDYDVKDSLYDGFGSWSSLSSSSTENDESSEANDPVIEIQQVVEVIEVVEPPPIMEVSEKAGSFNQVVPVYEQCGGGDVVEDEVDLNYEDEDEDDEVDLDDELVPWGLNEKLGRGRMRKLGKRSYSKMGKAKRVAFTFDRPGCVHGKHGLGLKHSF